MPKRHFVFALLRPTPDDQYSFDIQDSLITVFFSKHISSTIDSYGLIEVMPDGKDSLIATTTSTSFALPREKGKDITVHNYKIVGISHGNLSEPTKGFENQLTYADRLSAAGRYDEAFEAYQLAVPTMAKGGRIRDYTSAQLAATGKLLASRSEATKALQFLRLGFSLNPENADMRNAYSMGYAAYFGQMANREDFKGIISEADRMMSTPALRIVITQAIDSVANNVARIPSVKAINNAIVLGKQLIAWEPTNPGFNASLANAYLALYTIKRLSGDPVFELEAALKDADRYAALAVDGLRKNKLPYFREQLIHLEVINAAGRFTEAEKLAFAELSSGASGMSSAQTVDYRNHLAEAYAGQGKHDLAVLEFERILTIDPTNTTVKKPMAISLIETKQYDKAREVYQQLLLNDRDNATYIAGIGIVELRKGNYAEASFQLEKACKKDPADRSFYGPLAEAYQAASNYQKSIDNYYIAILFEEEKLEHARDGFASAREVERISKSLERYLENCAVLNNQIGNYEKAIENYNKLVSLNKNNAEAYYGLGKTSLGAGHIYDAINAFSAACRISPANTNYGDAKNNAIAERDRMAKEQPNLNIQDVYVRDVYPSLYRNYSDVRLLTLGEMVVSNNTGQTIAPTSIRVFVPDIMDAPTEIKAPSMVAYSNTYVSLAAIFKEKILNYTTEEKLQLEVTIDYMLGEQSKTVSKRIPFVVHGRNAITWSDKRCVGAFVSPAVDVLVDYNKNGDHLFRSQHTYGLNKSILKAMQLFTLLRQAGVTYSSDPSRNYALVSTQTDMLDYLQYPSETLKRKSGDCDDLVVLFAALLENGGVNAAFVDVPGHVFLAFESGIEPGNLVSAGLNELDVIIANDKVWIPLEMTLLSTHGFMASWRTAADRYYSELKAGRFPELISFSDARKVYVPSNYIPAGFNETPPNGKEVTQEYGTAVLQLLAKTKREVINEMESRYLSETENVYVKNKYASLLAQIGDDEKAEKVFLEALELSPTNPVVLNNLGNLYFLRGNAKNAIEYYERASKTDSFDGEILINLCKAYLLDGDKVQAGIYFDKAVVLDPQLDALYANLKNEVK
jgi:tetratricopeptide (TPR) repeat protein